MVSADTIVPDPGNPQAWNRYSYVNNNPINLTDPSGHAPSNGCGYEGCSLPTGFQSNNTWATVSTDQNGTVNVTYYPWDPKTMTTVEDRINTFIQGNWQSSPSPKSPPNLSNTQQTMVDIFTVTALASDISSLGLSGGGAMVEVGMLAIDGPLPLGELGGIGLYYEVINPFENFTSALGFFSTAAADVVKGNNYIQTRGEYLEIGIGQDTLVSGTGIALGNFLPLEGFLDTAVNIPVVVYDLESAAGNIPTLVELRWNTEDGFFFYSYPSE